MEQIYVFLYQNLKKEEQAFIMASIQIYVFLYQNLKGQRNRTVIFNYEFMYFYIRI